jgi:hypothetical protein
MQVAKWGSSLAVRVVRLPSKLEQLLALRRFRAPLAVRRQYRCSGWLERLRHFVQQGHAGRTPSQIARVSRCCHIDDSQSLSGLKLSRNL